MGSPPIRKPRDDSYKNSELTIYLREHPVEARQRILNVVRQVGGNVTEAAKVLLVHRITLWHIVNRCGLAEEVGRIRALVERVYKVRTHRRGFGTRRLKR